MEQWLFDLQNRQWNFHGYANATDLSSLFPMSEHTTWVFNEYFYIFGGITGKKGRGACDTLSFVFKLYKFNES
jgi:hypothetical protein